MLRINAIPNSAAAKRYYSSADYYLEGHEAPAQWHGKGAELLGIEGAVKQEDFERLCDNLHPVTGQQLTVKTLTNRRVGYDLTFSLPKSVSLAYALGQDDRIPDVFREAVADTMAEMEREMATRVRRKGADHDRTTGNMVWAGFLHHTSRPIDGTPDPQLHIHAVAFNATFDHEEGQWKAGQFGELKANGAYFQAVFRSRLANRLQEMGYEIRRVKDDFEITGPPDRALKEFSRRTDLIERVAEKLGITRPETKAKLGATTRTAKLKDGRTWASLVGHWEKRLRPGELEQINAAVVASLQGPLAVEDRSRESVDWALQHLLERKAVVPERSVMTEALKHGLGAVTLEDVQREMQRSDLIRKAVGGRVMVSTRSVLEEENRIVRFAVRGRGKYRPLQNERDRERSLTGDSAPATVYRDSATTDGEAQAKKEGDRERPPSYLSGEQLVRDTATLTPSQSSAIRHVLTSPDRLILIRGAAGTGKTTLIKTTLAAVNTPWQILAPSAEASRGVLKREGFENADTLARFLVDQQMQERVRNGLIWLDEASLAGSRDVARLVELADSLNARIVLSGDRRQHKSVTRGDVLALLEDRAGLPVAVVSEIKRQSGEYKLAVQALAKGDVAGGFQRLNDLGWIREAEGYEAIAADYIDALRTKSPRQKDSDRVIVVAPTHVEGEAVTAAIREKLKTQGRLFRRNGTVREEGVLKGEERTFERLVPLHLTEAELEDGRRLESGDVFQFLRRSGAHQAGERVAAGSVLSGTRHGRLVSAYRPGEIRFAAGDLIRITANGKDITGKHRLNNGSTYTVAGFTDAGNIRLDNGWVLDKLFGHLTHGYVVTSHAAQGRTVDKVLIAQGPQSLPASSAAQFYVSISRGRHQATIYTSDKSELFDAVQREDHRLLASDLVHRPRKGMRHRLKRHVGQLRQMVEQVRDRIAERTVERGMTPDR